MVQSPTAQSAGGSLSADLNFSKPYFASSEKFLVTLAISNSDTRPLKGDVVFALHSKLQLDLPLDSQGNVVFKRIWRQLPLKPGNTRLAINRSIPLLKLGPGAYPISITIVSQGQPVLEQGSMLVVIDAPKEEPSYPLAIVLLWNLHDRAHFDPQKIFVDNKIQLDCSRTLESPGVYANHLAAIMRHPDIRVNLAVTPLLVQQIEDLSRGFKVRKDGQILSLSSTSREAEDARQTLNEYRELFRTGKAELIPSPFAYPSLAFLANEEWDEDIHRQIDLGREILTRIFNLEIDTKSLYIPGLKLNSSTIPHLSSKGVGQTVLDGSVFEHLASLRPEGDVYRPHRIQDTKNNRLTVLFRDNNTSQSLEIMPAEAAAQTMLGRLAEIYLRRPGEQKVVVITPRREDWQPSGELLENLYGTLSQIPWLKTVSLKDALELAPPLTKPLMMIDQEEDDGYVKTQYYKKLRLARRDYRLFSRLTSGSNPIRKELSTHLLIAQGYDWTELRQPPSVVNLGLKFIDDIQRVVSRELGKINLISQERVTLPSWRGKIPVAIRNGTGYRVRVSVRLDGDNFIFPTGDAKSVDLLPKENLFSFPVETKTTEPSPLKISIKSGDRIIDQAEIMVNPTSFNRTIFFIVLAVILGLTLSLVGKRVISIRR